MEKIEYLAKQLAERIVMNWEFQLPTSFQDKEKAVVLLETLEGKPHARVSKKR